MALSTALDGKPATADAEVPIAFSVEEGECARVRASLVGAITGDRAFASSSRREAGDAGGYEPVDYAVFRQRYLAIQRTMQAATGKLRGRLRDVLAGTTTEMARLAAVDAVMEQALSPREQTLLATVPVLLGEHFERLRQAEQQMLADAQVAEDTPGAWLDAFRQDVQSVLLAELDVRFHPVEALLAALRTHSLVAHVQKSA